MVLYNCKQNLCNYLYNNNELINLQLYQFQIVNYRDIRLQAKILSLRP